MRLELLRENRRSFHFGKCPLLVDKLVAFDDVERAPVSGPSFRVNIPVNPHPSRGKDRCRHNLVLALIEDLLYAGATPKYRL